MNKTENIPILLQTEDELAYSLAQQVKYERIAQNMTQQMLAEKTQLPIMAIQRFEQKGQIQLTKFLLIIRALGATDILMQILDFRSKRELVSIDEMLQVEASKTKQRVRYGKKM